MTNFADMREAFSPLSAKVLVLSPLDLPSTTDVVTSHPQSDNLIRSARGGNTTTLKILLHKGGFSGEILKKAFMQAVECGNHACVVALFPHQTWDTKFSSIGLAKTTEVLTYLLIRQYQSVRYDDWCANTCLYAAIKREDRKLLLILIAMGVDINRRIDDDKTALQLYVRSHHTCHYYSFLLLIAAGADISIPFSDGKTMMQWALEHRYNRTYHYFNDLQRNGEAQQQNIKEFSADIAAARKQWHNAVLAEYDLSGRTYTGTWISILPRDLLTWYILPYLGALSPLEIT